MEQRPEAKKRHSAGSSSFGIRPAALKKAAAELSRPIMSRLPLIGKKSDVSHLSAWTNGAFPVQMQVGGGKVQKGATFRVGFDRLGIRSNEIHHGRRAQQSSFLQWDPTHGTDLLLELRRTTRVKCVMAGIMGPRSDFVDEELFSRQQKQFETKETDPFHPSNHRMCKLHCPLHHGCRYVCRDDCRAKNPFFMFIFNKRIDDG